MNKTTENQMRDNVRKRGSIAFRNMILIGIPALLLGGAGAILFIAAPFVFVGSRRLSKHGVFCEVSAIPDYMTQTVKVYKTISSGSKLPELLIQIMRTLGYLIPSNLVQYHFELNGKTTKSVSICLRGKSPMRTMKVVPGRLWIQTTRV